MVATCAVYSIQSILAKLAERRIPSLEVVAIRSLIAGSMTFATLVRRGLAAPVSEEDQTPSHPSWDVVIFGPRHLRHLVIVRGFFGSVAFSLLYAALPLLPIGEFQAILFINPIVIFLLAYPILGEPVGLIEAVAVCFSFIGTLCIVRPSIIFGDADRTQNEAKDKALGTAFALSGALLVAVVMVTVRFIGKRVQSVVLAFSFHSFSCVFGATLLLLGAQQAVWPSLEDALYLGGVSVSSFFGQIMLNYSYSTLPASRASSLNYLQVAFSFLLGWIFLGEVALPWSIIGSILIMLSGGMVTYFRETTKSGGACPAEPVPVVVSGGEKEQSNDNGGVLELIDGGSPGGSMAQCNESSDV